MSSILINFRNIIADYEFYKNEEQEKKLFAERMNSDVEFCKFAIQQNWRTLQYVKDELQTEEICKIAVQQNAFAISDINYDSRTEEICRLAVQKEKWYMQYAPDHIKRKLEKK